MTPRRRATVAVAVTLLVVTPVRAGQFLGASLSLGYGGVAADSEVAAAQWHHSLLQNYGAGLSGPLLADGLLDYRLSANYSNLRSRSPGLRLTTDNLSYNLAIDALRREPVTLAAHASRGIQTSASKESLALEQVGTVTVTSLGASSEIDFENAPQLQANVAKRVMDVASAFGERSSVEQLQGALRVRQQSEFMRYGISAAGLESSGSSAGSSFESYEARLEDTIDLNRDAYLTATAEVYRREATVVEERNPSYLTYAASAVFVSEIWETLTSNTTYGYSHHGASELRFGESQSTQHALASNVSYSPDKAWSLRGGAQIANFTQSLGDESASAWSESIGAHGELRHAWSAVEVQGQLGVNTGVTHPSRGASGGSYGGTALVAASATAIPYSALGVTTDGSWARDTSSLGGTSLAFGVRAHSSTKAIPYTRLDGTLDARRSQRQSTLQPRAVDERLAGRLAASWRSLSLTIDLEYRNGASRMLANPLDPLALPESFNVRSQLASLSLGGTLVDDLTLTAAATRVVIRSPSSSQRADSAESILAYHVGALTFDLRYRFAHERSNGSDALTHSVFTMVSRAFNAEL